MFCYAKGGVDRAGRLGGTARGVFRGGVIVLGTGEEDH